MTNNYILNNYRIYKFGENKNLVTTDHGSWCLLDDRELDLLKKMKVHEDSNLFNFLLDKGVIVTGDNFNKIVEDYRQRFHFLFRGPTLHIVVPTFRCNHNCVYCHSIPKSPETKGVDMDEETAKRVVDFILNSPSKLLVIELQGGDCLYNFDTVKFIIDYGEEVAKSKNKRLLFNVVTNLTLMDEEKLNFLKKHQIMGLATSLDGPKEVHDANRKYIDGNGSYDDVVYWIKRIKTEFRKDFNLNALTTVTKFSLPYAKEIAQEFKKLGFYVIWPRFLNDLGLAHNKMEKIGYSAEEYLFFWKELFEEVLKINKAGKLLIESYGFYITKKILNKQDPMYVDMMAPCGAGIGQLLYDHKGDIYTCDEAKILGDMFKLGNVKDAKLKDIIGNPTVISMMNVSSMLTTLCDACPWFSYCGLCPVNTFMAEGTIIPKLPNDFRHKVFYEMIKTVFEKVIFNESERSILTKWINTNIIR
jgi:His-Xaa-Ser system radical SAM maturase HxsB